MSDRCFRTHILIAAVANDGCIGRGGTLPWHLRDDLRHFKRITDGQTVLMGRRTFESLPKGALPNRRNIVVSRRGITAPNVEVFPDLDSALEVCSGRVFIIGGASLYRQVSFNEAYITYVDCTIPDGDVYMPELLEFEFNGGWRLCSEKSFPANEDNDYPFCIKYYQRT